jgi:hypothetical protein
MALDMWKGIPIITRPSQLDAAFIASDSPDNEMKGGYDSTTYVPTMHASPKDLETTPESEDDARFEEQEAGESSLRHLHLRSGQPNLDQGSVGYCWAYSTAHSIMMDRLRRGLPYVRLSAHAVGCKIKNFRDEGGWCGLSGKFATEGGYPSVDFWKEKSMSRSYDTKETWDNAKLHLVTENWYDLTRPEYDQELSKRQIITSLFQNNPCPADWDALSHSMCAVQRVRIEKGRWGTMVINSWKGWGFHGLGILADALEWPNNAISTRSSTASIK